MRHFATIEHRRLTVSTTRAPFLKPATRRGRELHVLPTGRATARRETSTVFMVGRSGLRAWRNLSTRLLGEADARRPEIRFRLKRRLDCSATATLLHPRAPRREQGLLRGFAGGQ